jgi:hypothetical protein
MNNQEEPLKRQCISQRRSRQALNMRHANQACVTPQPAPFPQLDGGGQLECQLPRSTPNALWSKLHGLEVGCGW